MQKIAIFVVLNFLNKMNSVRRTPTGESPIHRGEESK